MNIKSYFASSVEAAVVQARKELGPDAMLVNSRRNPDADGGAGQYEVVFGVAPGVAPIARPVPAPAAAPQGLAPEVSLPELAEIRRQIRELQSALSSARSTTPKLAAAPAETDWSELKERLVNGGLSFAAAEEIVQGVSTRMRNELRTTRPSAREIEAAVREALSDQFRTVNLFAKGRDVRTLALVGPPGSGKTTTLFKLAIRYGLAEGRSVQIVSADPHRVAGSEKGRMLASLLGVTYEVADTFGALMRALKSGRPRDLVLIDTPGYSFVERDSAEELAGHFEYFPDLSTHLVLPASMKTSDLPKVADVYAPFLPSSLMFTRLDETSTWGGILSESLRLGLPVSFVAGGQSIPEDLAPASSDSLLENLFGPGERIESVA